MKKSIKEKYICFPLMVILYNFFVKSLCAVFEDFLKTF